MGELKKELLDQIGSDFSMFWDVLHAVHDMPRLFALVKPEKRVRDALKALNCKHDKDIQFATGTSAAASGAHSSTLDASVSIDVNAFRTAIYEECETCPARAVCKEAFVICTEYVWKALTSAEAK